MAVPAHTHKVVLWVHQNGDKEMSGFDLPNIDKPSGKIASYTFSVSEIEKLTGLDFFNSLAATEQAKLERVVNTLRVP